MIAALLSIAVCPQVGPVQLGTVDVGGRQVAVTVPATPGPYGPDTPHVTIDGFKYVVGPDFNLGTRYLTDGGWGEVAQSYPSAAQKAAAAPEYRIKVFVLDNTSVLEEGRDGVWRERYGSLSPAQKDEIYAALARTKALAETASGGAVRLTFDVTVDSDLLFRVARPGATGEYRPPRTSARRMTVTQRPEAAGLLGPEWIFEEFGPRINNDPFEAEDGKYRGPYSSVFIVHAMRTWDAATTVLDRTPVTSVSWPTFTDRAPGPALSIQLFKAWLQHLAVSADASLRDVAMGGVLPSGDALPADPQVFATPVTPELLTAGNRLLSPGFGDGVPDREFGATDFSIADARAGRFSKLPPLRGEGVQTLQGWVPMRGALVAPAGEHTAVHPSVVARFMEENPDAGPMGRIENADGGWDYVLFSGATRKENDLSSLGLSLGTFPATMVVGPGPTTGTLEFDPNAVGDFDVVAGSDPQVGPLVTVVEQGEDRRGYAVLASSSDGQPLFRVEEGSGVRFKASCDLADAYVLSLIARSGQKVDVLLFGDARVPAEATSDAPWIDARRRAVPFWNEFVVPLGDALAGQDIVEVRIAPPRYGPYYARVSDGSKSLKIGAISFGPLSTAEPPQTEPFDEELLWISKVEGTLDADGVVRVRRALRSDSVLVRINALAAMARTKNSELIPDIGPLASSGFAGESYLAIQALKHQNEDKAWSQIAFAAIRGPFGTNYMFAAEALGDKQEDVTLDLLGVPLLSLSWHARLAAMKSVNKIESEQAAIIASATLSSPEPDPVVRFVTVGRPRPQSGLFSRRLLFAAVNDESEWVRATSYLSLLDVEDEEIREQALRGVRDESVAVRLAILGAMAAQPKDHYRGALRVAVVDPAPIVRTAALRAFAVQPGAVVAGEVQNVLTDKNPMVRAALLELARAKGIEVPPAP